MTSKVLLFVILLGVVMAADEAIVSLVPDSQNSDLTPF